MKLSSQQIEVIRQVINQSNVSITTLKDDLLDHLCCAVEDRMERGVPLETAIIQSLNSLAPNGLNEIQRETIFLLNSKIIIMKKVMFLTGLLSTISISLGIIFKMLNWLGASELFVFGTLGFIFLFLPVTVVIHYRATIQKALSEKLRLMIGVLSAVLFGCSMIFKILNWPGADELLLAAGAIFSFGFLPVLFYKMYRRSLS